MDQFVQTLIDFIANFRAMIEELVKTKEPLRKSQHTL